MISSVVRTLYDFEFAVVRTLYDFERSTTNKQAVEFRALP